MSVLSRTDRHSTNNSTALDHWFLKKIFIFKFGGAFLKDKSKIETIRSSKIDLLIQIIKNIEPTYKIIIVNGAGSFGHFTANEYKLKNGQGFNNPTEFRKGFAKTRISLSKLNIILLERLSEFNLLTVSMNYEALPFQQVDNVLKSGFIPVLHGDVVFKDTMDGNGTVYSGDLVVMELSNYFKNSLSHVVFLTGVAGIFGRRMGDESAMFLDYIDVNIDGKVLAELDSIQVAHSSIVDVTGGMKSKLKVCGNIVKDCKVPLFILCEVGEF